MTETQHCGSTEADLIGTRDPAGRPALFLHSVATLTYRLIEGPVRLEPLRILASRALDWDGWRVTLYVLGASHAVSLERDGSRLVELLTCVPPAFAAAEVEPVLELPGTVPAARCVRTAGLAIRAQVQPFLLRDGAELIGSFGPEARLAIRFGDMGAPEYAVTEIGWHAEPDVLRVETIHTYPEEGRGVRTRTEFARQHP